MQLTRNLSTFNTVANEEAHAIQVKWERTPFEFFKTRYISNYEKPITKNKRKKIELETGLKFPAITSDQLDVLYKKVVHEYENQTKNLATNGFDQTKYEKIFLKNLNKAKNDLKKMAKVDIYPATETSVKIVVGPYILDFILFGITQKGYSALCLEVDGGIHLAKAQKDDIRNAHLASLGILTYSIQNPFALDSNFTLKFLSDEVLRDISKHKDQTERILSNIKLFTVAYHWSLQRIEVEYRSMFGENLNLRKELEMFADKRDCPRKIKKEWALLCC